MLILHDGGDGVQVQDSERVGFYATHTKPQGFIIRPPLLPTNKVFLLAPVSCLSLNCRWSALGSVVIRAHFQLSFLVLIDSRRRCVVGAYSS